MEKPVKLLICVIGFSGLIAALIPTDLPTPPNPQEPTEALDAPVIGTTVGNDNVEVQVEHMGAVESPQEQEVFKFGEPTIDGKPYGAIDEAPTKTITSTDSMPQIPVLQDETDVAVPVAD